MYLNLVLSGGSLKGVSFIGTIQFLEERKIIDSIKNFIGVSFGALVCFYNVIGYNSKEILSLFKHQVKNYKAVDPEVILNLFTTMGLDDGSYIESCLRKVLHYKLGCSDISFIELTKATGKNLVITVANVTTHSTEFFSVDTTPDMSVIKALRMSCCIPFVFTPIVHNNCLYVDGGMFCNFPLEYFKDDKTPFKDTIGLVIENNVERVSVNKLPTNIIEYVQTLLYSVFFHINDKPFNNQKNNVIVINFNDSQLLNYQWDTLSFSMDDKIVDQYIQQGYDAAKSAFTSNVTQETN